MFGIESLTLELLAGLGLPFLAVVFFMEGALIGKMLPTDLLLIAAAVVYVTQTQYFYTILAITVTASTAGQFWLFQRFRDKTVDDLHESSIIKLSDKNIDKLFKALDNRGLTAVTVSNMVPGIRGLLTIPAAIEGVDKHKFVTASATGTIVFHGLVIGVTSGIITSLIMSTAPV